METMMNLIQPMNDKIFNFHFGNNYETYAFILQLIGLIWFLTIIIISGLWTIFKEVYCIIVYKLFISNDFKKKYGEWAVVTGATDGIGKSYSFELARRGMNIILISRNETKLKNCAAEIEKECGVKTKCIQVNFSDRDQIYETIEDQLENYDIGVLVNNVGFAKLVSYTMQYYQTTKEEISDQISINCDSVVQMTRIVLPRLVQKKKGLIVNIGSLSGILPVPYLSVYSATKAFVGHFVRALQLECLGSGVQVQLLTPGFIGTNMTADLKYVSDNDTVLVPGPDTFARHAIRTAGIVKECGGYWLFDLQVWGSKLLPFWFSSTLMRLVFYYQYGSEFMRRDERNPQS